MTNCFLACPFRNSSTKIINILTIYSPLSCSTLYEFLVWLVTRKRGFVEKCWKSIHSKQKMLSCCNPIFPIQFKLHLLTQQLCLSIFDPALGCNNPALLFPLISIVNGILFPTFVKKKLCSTIARNSNRFKIRSGQSIMTKFSLLGYSHNWTIISSNRISYAKILWASR